MSRRDDPEFQKMYLDYLTDVFNHEMTVDEFLKSTRSMRQLDVVVETTVTRKRFAARKYHVAWSKIGVGV
jgi:hypothetical protein